MTTKLSRFCEAIIEAGWLAALIYVPLFFDVHSSRVFEPDKISLLRSIALVMAVAWVIKALNDGVRRKPEDAERVSLWRRIVATPLVLPTLLLVLVYLISTVFSINPRVSFFGSYQRLQGTYSTLSYIVIFFLALGHLRRPEQWRRMAFTIVLVSVPIAIYGLLQRAGLDPLPWGGDVQRRIAGNMGNAIFVAAYLIMAFFLTLERLLEHMGRLLRGDDSRQMTVDALLAAFYLFIIAVQSLAIIYTQSRGPLLGWGAGTFVFILLFLLGLRGSAGAEGASQTGGLTRSLKRWLWAPWIALGIGGVVFLVVFNIPGSPLAPLRTNPLIGRLGTALDLESQTARVRTLIWQGAAELIAPHAPLEYPATGEGVNVTETTPDRLNVLRPLIGYGPEAMWMAFNPFYPPDLAHYEDRNASPDRSHNETFDSLVFTGLLGFAAYMALFLSIFYYSLSWLGLMRSRAQKLLFFLLVVGGALVGTLAAYLSMGNWVLLGIALPAGLILGLIAYILIAAIWNEVAQQPMRLGQRELILATILATVIGHFIEIHFGIAIASTRTYFWIWSAVLVVLGMGWLKLQAEAVEPAAQPVPAAATGRKKPRSRAAAPARPAPSDHSPWGEVVIYAVILGIVLFIIAFDYTINPNVLDLRSTNPLVVFVQSFTSRVDSRAAERFTSLGLFWMVVFVVLVGTVVSLLDIARSRSAPLTRRWLGRGALISLGVSLGLFVGLGLLHAATVARDAARQKPGGSITLEQLANMSSSHITEFTIISLLLISLLAFVVWRTRRGGPGWLGAGGWLAPAVGAPLALVALLIIFNLNASLVRADIVYKQGQAYDNAGRYTEAIQLYQMAIDEEPREDYYYLFLGRAQLEQARASSGNEQLRFLAAAEQSLLRAQELNPLNTDHTANLGRLYLAWSQLISSGTERQAVLQKSLDQYSVATRLSPNAAHLHNEYATALQVAGQQDQALEQFDISLALDQEYPDTYRRLGDFYQRTNQIDKAIEIYEEGLKVSPRNVAFHSNLGLLYAQQDDKAKAIEHNLAVLETRPNDLASIRNLALLYSEAGDYQAGLTFAQRALELVSTDEDRSDLQTLIEQLQAQLGN